MALTVKHAFTNPIADEPGFTGTKPSDWNADHVVTDGGRPVVTPSTPGFVASQALLGLPVLQFYVNGGTGNDSNDGVSAGTAFQTVMRAVQVAQSYDYDNKYLPYIEVAAGSYNEDLLLGGVTNMAIYENATIYCLTGESTCSIGDTTFNAGAFTLDAGPGEASRWQLFGIHFIGACQATYGAFCLLGGETVATLPCSFDFSNAFPYSAFQATYGGSLNIADYGVTKISGSYAGPLFSCDTGLSYGNGVITVGAINNGGSVQFVGSPVYTAIVSCDSFGTFISRNLSAWTGAVTGKKFTLTNNSSYITDLAYSAIPGSTDGTADPSSYFNGVAGGAVQKSGAPAATDLFPGSTAVFKDTSQGTGLGIAQWYNDAGTIVSLDTGGGGAPGGSNTDVQFNNSSAFGGDGAFTYAGSGAATIGAASTGTGKINFKGTTSGTVTLSTLDAAGTWTMKLPATAGTNGYSLVTDGSGNTTWSNISGGSGSPSGSNLSFQYNDSGAFNGGAPGLAFVDANTIEQRNGTNAQTFHQYITFTDASNYERLDYSTDANGIALKFGSLGTGTARAISVTGGGSGAGSIVCWETGKTNSGGDTVFANIFAQGGSSRWEFGVAATGALFMAPQSDSYCAIRGNTSGSADVDIIGAGEYNANPAQLRLKQNGDVQFIQAGVAIAWTLQLSGNYPIYPQLDDTSDIGLAGTNRVRNLYLSQDIYSGNASFMHRTTTSLSNGAGANLGTLTNAPTAGNPTKWIPIDDNGTTRYIPAW